MDDMNDMGIGVFVDVCRIFSLGMFAMPLGFSFCKAMADVSARLLADRKPSNITVP